jgi:hypothetical protein
MSDISDGKAKMLRDSIRNKNIQYYRRLMLTQNWAIYRLVAHSFDKAILALSTASLGFTLGLLQYISSKSAPLIHMNYLLYSLGGFISAIIATLLALLCTESYAHHQIEYFSSKLLNKSTNIDSHRCTDCLMVILQALAAICFIGALIWFTVFVCENVEVPRVKP